MESAVGDAGEGRGTRRTTPKLPGRTFPGVPAVPKRRRWLDKEFAEYEIAAIVSAAMTRGVVLSTSDPFTILSRTLRARTYIRHHVRPKVVQGRHLAGCGSSPKSSSLSLSLSLSPFLGNYSPGGRANRECTIEMWHLAASEHGEGEKVLGSWKFIEL